MNEECKNFKLKKEQKLEYIDQYFTPSDIIDLVILENEFQNEAPRKLLNKPKIDIDRYLDMLELTETSSLQKAVRGVYYFCVAGFSESIKFDFSHIEVVYWKDGLPLILNYLPRLLAPLFDIVENPDIEPLYVEHELRVALNAIYLIMIQNLESANICEELLSSPLESVLSEIIRLSLEVPSFIPMKKLIMLYDLYLNITLRESPLSENKHKYLTKDLVEKMCSGEPRINAQDPNQIEIFYQRFLLKSQEGAKPQIFIRALITALLALAPQGKKSQIANDSFTEWESAYLLLELLQAENKLSASALAKTEVLMNIHTENKIHYENRKEPSTPTNAAGVKIVLEGERHRIMLGNAILSLFEHLVQRLGANDLFQYLYLTQLLADEKGVLVYLKFLTDGFSYLASERVPCIDEFQGQERNYLNITEDSVFKTVKLTYKICRGSQEKIETNLIEKNAYFLVKKMPTFFKDSSRMASVCHKLLRIQTKLFTKKQRQLASNMRVVTEIFCKETNLQNLEKQRRKEAFMAKMMENFKQEDVKKILNDFNNYNYLTLKTMQNENLDINLDLDRENNSVKSRFSDIWTCTQIPQDFAQNYERWLEDNVFHDSEI